MKARVTKQAEGKDKMIGRYRYMIKVMSATAMHLFVYAFICLIEAEAEISLQPISLL